MLVATGLAMLFLANLTCSVLTLPGTLLDCRDGVPVPLELQARLQTFTIEVESANKRDKYASISPRLAGAITPEVSRQPVLLRRC
jgi:hypothetical protein